MAAFMAGSQALKDHALTAVAPPADHLWAALDDAARFDATVTASRSDRPQLLARYVAPMPYSRDRLFARMLVGEPSILSGFPIPARGMIRDLPPDQAAAAIVDWLAARRSPAPHRIATGPASPRQALSLREFALKWRDNSEPLGITDLHIRNTRMEEIIDPDELSAFNLLRRSTAAARRQEMFSFVIGTRGYVTDSHSDDPDSSNYCFTGRKLWLSWDTYEGIAHGLEDVERMAVAGRARFDLATWLSLPSARWFLVGPDQTLFLPAHLTHKVITLDPYVGVGGFFIALPNCLRLLGHWLSRGPLWSKRDATGEKDGLLGDIAEATRQTVLALRAASMSERMRWGYDHLNRSARAFIASCPPDRFRLLWSDPRFRMVAETIRAPWPLPASDPLRFEL